MVDEVEDGAEGHAEGEVDVVGGDVGVVAVDAAHQVVGSVEVHRPEEPVAVGDDGVV